MRRGVQRRASALVFVLVLVIIMGAAVLTIIAFASHVAGVEGRSESSAIATMAMDGAISDIRSELAAGTIGGPGTVPITVGPRSVTCVITDNSGVIPYTYSVAASVLVSGKQYANTYVIGHPTGHGLLGQYFDSTSSGHYYSNLLYQRIDGNVNFSWGGGSPESVVGVDYFTARWTGTVTPTASGNYTFTTTSDDGVRLWVNGQLVISDWTLHGPTNDTSASIALTSGQSYDIRLDYFENTGGAVCQLQWTPPSSSLQAISTSVLSPNPLPVVSYSYADLSSYYNQDGYSFSTNKPDGNLGGSGKTFPAEWLPSRLRFNGVRYIIGSAADATNNVVQCSGQTLTMPSGNYSSVRVLVVSTSGTQTDTFTLKYSDASTVNSSPSIYDWRAAPTIGESVALSVPETYTSASGIDWTMAHMQVITLAANPAKTLSSLKLPTRATTAVLAVTCVN